MSQIYYAHDTLGCQLAFPFYENIRVRASGSRAFVGFFAGIFEGSKFGAI
jgi:hypothetical protein